MIRNTSSKVCSISRHSDKQSAELQRTDQPCLSHTLWTRTL